MEPLFSFTGDIELARFLDTTSSRIIVTSQTHGAIVLDSEGDHERTIDTAQRARISVVATGCSENVYAIHYGDIQYANDIPRNLRVRLFNLNDGTVTHNLTAPRGEICGGLALIERPESSSILATGSNTGAILVWRLNDAVVPSILPGHIGNIQDTKIYNGFIVSFGEDGTVRVWELDSGACLYILGDHVGWISSEFLDLRRIATLDVEGQLRVWSLENGSCLVKRERPAGENFFALSYTPQHLISRDNRGAIYVWNRTTWALDCIIQTHEAVCISAIWTGNGETIVTVGFDGQMRVWNLESASMMSRYVAPILVVPVDGVRDMKRIGRRLVTLAVPVSARNGLVSSSERRFDVELWDIEQIDTIVESSRLAVSPLMLNAPAR